MDIVEDAQFRFWEMLLLPPASEISMKAHVHSAALSKAIPILVKRSYRLVMRRIASRRVVLMENRAPHAVRIIVPERAVQESIEEAFGRE